jgi:hypothetical protein
VIVDDVKVASAAVGRERLDCLDPCVPELLKGWLVKNGFELSPRLGTARSEQRDLVSGVNEAIG